jgi:uncharacterized protein (DUF2236 family)
MVLPPEAIALMVALVPLVNAVVRELRRSQRRRRREQQQRVPRSKAPAGSMTVGSASTDEKVTV